MELQVIDVLYVLFIVIVVLAGVICLIIFLPKEHDLEDKTSDCYRIALRNGKYHISSGKAGLEENLLSFWQKYTYIKRLPFYVECYFDDDDDEEAGEYRAAARITVFFPEEKLDIFAPTFSGLKHDAVCETISETASVALKEALAEIGGNKENEEALKESFKAKAAEKLAIFGLELTKLNELRVFKINR